MRVACLNAVKHVPSLGKCVSREESTVATLLWMALYDPEEVNKNLTLLSHYASQSKAQGLCVLNEWMRTIYPMY